MWNICIGHYISIATYKFHNSCTLIDPHMSSNGMLLQLLVDGINVGHCWATCTDQKLHEWRSLRIITSNLTHKHKLLWIDDLIPVRTAWLHTVPLGQWAIVPSKYQRDWHISFAVVGVLTLLQSTSRLWRGWPKAPPTRMRTEVVT